MRVSLVLALAPLVCSDVSATEESWRFVSMPDFLNVDTDHPQDGWEDAVSYILQSVKAEKPDFLLVPGDLVMGEWHERVIHK